MSFFNLFNPKDSLLLFGYDEEFVLFKNLILNNKLPNVVMFSGKKGIGKSTFVNHLLHFYFDKKNYDEKNKSIKINSSFHLQFRENVFSNIIYLDGSNFNSTKIDDIRILKKNLSKTPLNNEKRFIILDDVECFNLNSLNALLKIIEEPGDKNYFILINNKTNKLIETIKSRSLEIKIILNEKKISEITLLLIKSFDQKFSLDIDLINSSPGTFLKYNYLINEKQINIDDRFIDILKTILNLYKKEKDIFYKDFLLFIIEYHIKKKMLNNVQNHENLLEIRLFIAKKINEFFLYKLNQNTLLSSIESKLK